MQRTWIIEIDLLGRRRIPQRLHAVVRGLHIAVLALQGVGHGGGDVRILQRLAVGGHGHVFTTLALGEDGVVVLGGEGGFQINPAAVQRTTDGAAVFRLAFAQVMDEGLELSREGAALQRELAEEGFQVRGLDVLAGGPKAFLAVFEGFDEVVKNRCVGGHGDKVSPSPPAVRVSHRRVFSCYGFSPCRPPPLLRCEMVPVQGFLCHFKGHG